MMEIELKARLRDKAGVEARVKSFATFTRSFDKSDEYWHGPEWRFVRGTKGFRLRIDGQHAIVTFKQKRNDGGIEINKETEFEVSDACSFKALVERIGCEPFYKKRKIGRAYEFDSCTIEIVEVEGLGDFIEIERLLEIEDPEAIAIAQGTLKKVLSMSGVLSSDIEGRGYSELVLEARGKDRS